MNAVMSKWCLVCVSLMASHIIFGQTNYYITVSQPFVTGPAKIDHVSANYTELYFR